MTLKTRFGLLFDFRNPAQWLKPWPQFYADMIDFAAWTETLGFSDVWLTEHHGAEDGYSPSPLMIASAIATRTKRVHIGTAIALAPFYHPVRLAEDLATLDLISNGRIEFGFGLGYRPEEFAAYGLSMKTRGSRASEVLDIVRRLWDGETVTVDSKHFKLDGAQIMPRPAQAHPPLWVGGFSPEAMKRVARYGDGFMWGPGGPDLAAAHRLYVDALAVEGKPADAARMLQIWMWLMVSEDPERTFAEVAPHVLHQINTYAKWLSGTGHQSFVPADVATLKASGQLMIMTPDEAIKFFKSQMALAPLEGFAGMTPPAGFPLDKLAPYIELFANKVLPAFK